MPSTAYRRWATTGASALNEIAGAHAAVGGSGPGRRYTTQQVNQAYAVLLAGQFQKFCRDLHSECADYLVTVLGTPSAALGKVVSRQFTWARQLDRGNAHSGSLKEDFGRLGIDLWAEMDHYVPRSNVWRSQLDVLNVWRNAIAHQDFNPAKIGGATNLRLAQVRRWRVACRGLARGLDEVMRRHLQTLTGAPPW